jgi:primary-amine oxidase
VNLSHGYVESNVRLGANVHACADGEEVMRVEQTVLEDEGVKGEVAKLKLPEGSVVVCDPWIYGKLSLLH